MKTKNRYFLFSVAQYVHAQREECLNVGVVVYDPDSKRVICSFDSDHATKRIKQLYPDVDRRGLQMYLQDLSRGLPTDPLILAGIQDEKPLHVLSSWQSVVQFKTPRLFPAENHSAALSRLTDIYVGDYQKMLKGEQLSGVTKAKRLTREAIIKVLNPVEGFGVRDVEIPRTVKDEDGSHLLPIKFPFLILDNVVIDALTFDGGQERALFYADHFIRKVVDLKKLPETYHPHATVVVDKAHRDRGRALISYVRQHTALAEWAVTEAEEAEVMIEEIKHRHAA